MASLPGSITETIFFDPIAIGLFKGQFVGDAVGANPPVKALWSQAQDFWGDDRLQRNLRCLGRLAHLLRLVRESEKAVEESFQILYLIFKSKVTAKACVSILTQLETARFMLTSHHVVISLATVLICQPAGAR
jgi:hypothetical protein